MNTRERLIELLSDYFVIGDTYAYNLVRVKYAPDIEFEDFEEFSEDTIEEIVDYLIENGITIKE